MKSFILKNAVKFGIVFEKKRKTIKITLYTIKKVYWLKK